MYQKYKPMGLGGLYFLKEEENTGCFKIFAQVNTACLNFFSFA